MAKTRAQLVDLALENLGVKPAGQASSAEDYSLVDSLVDPLVDYLIEKDVCFVENLAVIPDAWFVPLGEVLAFMAAPKYGGGFDQTKLNQRTQRPLAEDDLKTMNRVRPTYAVLATDDF